VKILELRNKDKAGKEFTCGKFEIKNQTDISAELYIYGDIMNYKWEDSDVVPQDVAEFLKTLDGKSKLNIFINSGGGSVFAGLAIYNQLKRHAADKTIYIDGVAASIASVIAMAGDRIVIPSNAFLMIHKPWSWQIGNANDMRKMAEDLDRIEDGIMNVYQTRLVDGVEIGTIRDLVQAETWLTGTEAAKYFRVEAGEENQAAACSSEYFEKYKNAPVKLKERPEAPADPSKNNLEKEKLLLELDLL
jgi:ATP-dependent Clp protease protease subunit